MGAGKFLISSERFPDHLAVSSMASQCHEVEDLLQANSSLDSRRRTVSYSSPRRRAVAIDSRRRTSTFTAEARRRYVSGPTIVGPTIVVVDGSRRRSHQECASYPIVTSSWVKEPRMEMLFYLRRAPMPNVQAFTIQSVENNCFLAARDKGESVNCEDPAFGPLSPASFWVADPPLPPGILEPLQGPAMAMPPPTP
eukprot:TRINITY_DN6510_c0_g1_i2.p1 TRINITY_DN6510_c0_g1~~TRINITY_DN6510_c0_g1_i2.p1  ORF type:complete len:196 (-),score=16.57 TRINITY_DN6510_c0_g1_i2:236-823(-)